MIIAAPLVRRGRWGQEECPVRASGGPCRSVVCTDTHLCIVGGLGVAHRTVFGERSMTHVE